MIFRNRCPACSRCDTHTVADLPYGEAPIATYLAEFYRAYPLCDFSPLFHARFQLADCRHCGCIYQVQVPDDAFLTLFYGEGLAAGTTSTITPVQTYQIEQQVRELMMVVRFLQATVPHPRILDFGAGDGAWAILAAAAGLKVAVSDLATHAFPRLAAHGITGFRVDALPKEGFDFINTEQVFEHLAQPAEVIQHLSRALRMGGVLKIGVPHDPRLRRKLRQPNWTAPKHSPASLNAVAPIEHLNHFEAASMHALGACAGLELLWVRGWGLVRTHDLVADGSLQRRASLWLKKRFGAVYSPYHALTQTWFFQKTVPDSQSG